MPPKQTVVHVVGQLDMGGMEKLLVEFAKHAARKRFDVRFVCLGARGALAEDIEGCGWPVTSLGHAGGRRLSLLARLVRLFREWRPDVVHTHNLSPLIYAAPAARLARVARVIHTRHGQSYGASRKERRNFRLMTSLVDHVVSVSADSAQITLRDGVAARRIRTILNGIDTALFDYVGPARGGPIVTVGRISPEKSFETLIHAVAIAHKQVPSIELEIAGAGPCLPVLRALVENLGLGSSVRLLGQVRDVPALLSRASLFVLPSLTEGVSLTLLEAMARGLPVVATAVGGNPEVVAHGETGLLVPAQSPKDLAEAMIAICKDAELGRRMGAAGRQRVERHFDARRMVAEYERLYRGEACIHTATNQDRDASTNGAAPAKGAPVCVE